MNDDDIYLTSGESYVGGDYYPEAPEEQVEKERVSVGIVKASYPIIDDVAAWFDTQIDASNQISNIQMTSLTINGVKYDRTISIEAQALAYQLLHDLLVDKAKDWTLWSESNG